MTQYNGQMATKLRSARRVIRGSGRETRPEDIGVEQVAGAGKAESEAPALDIAPNDPIIGYFQSVNGAVDVESLELESPGVEALRGAGIKLVVPLVSQGELIGLLNLGPRLSEQDYAGDDRKLLDNLAAQAAPAVRVGQLVRQQQAGVMARERIDQELRVAQLIQQNFLPRELPDLAGWQVGAYYRPAREVGGDFYDFIALSDDSLGIVIGDVTDKGVPAAMVMAATRSVLRASVQRLVSPGEVLQRVNELLCPDMPEKMFVTCLYAVLDQSSGRLLYANAGHNVPYVGGDGEVRELRATGMPLGLMPGMRYEEKETVLAPGASVLLHSDGLAEAHNQQREMFGFPRVMELVGAGPGGGELIDSLLVELERFTPPAWEQEDDITLVTLVRSAAAGVAASSAAPAAAATDPEEGGSPSEKNHGRLLAEFTIASEEGNERVAIERVAEAIAELHVPDARLQRLKTAVGEATMNAMEHGNRYQRDLPVSIRVLASPARVQVQVTDQGGGRETPVAETPDIEAKLAGLQQPRGWGLFLIERMVDEMTVTSDDLHHSVELSIDLKGDGDEDT